MGDPLLSIPFEQFLLAVVAVSTAIGVLTTFGMGEAYRSIGRGDLSLDVPLDPGDEPLDRDADHRFKT